MSFYNIMVKFVIMQLNYFCLVCRLILEFMYKKNLLFTPCSSSASSALPDPFVVSSMLCMSVLPTSLLVLPFFCSAPSLLVFSCNLVEIMPSFNMVHISFSIIWFQFHPFFYLVSIYSIVLYLFLPRTKDGKAKSNLPTTLPLCPAFPVCGSFLLTITALLHPLLLSVQAN